MFQVNDLRAGYAEHAVLRDVSFRLEQGSFTALLGANGCGKTTLLKAVCGILPHEGSCQLDGVPLEGLSARQTARLVSYVPQRSGIHLDMTALEVVLMGFNPWLKLLQQPTKQMHVQAQAALQQLGLSPQADYLTLSEGQKQLCILARAMVSKGKLLLLDEPESALDLANRYEVFTKLCGHLQGRAILAATHDPQLALRMAQQIILLKDGRVDSILHPQTDTPEKMEQALSRIYGAVRLYRPEETVVMIKV